MNQPGLPGATGALLSSLILSGCGKAPAQRGLDPNVWFNNVEQVAAEKIGRETVQYVSNIYKYYVAYKLTVEGLEATKALKK